MIIVEMKPEMIYEIIIGMVNDIEEPSAIMI